MRNLLLSATAAVSLIILAGTAHATPFSFTASQGSGDNALNASATITPGNGVLDLTLTNNVVNPKSAGQTVSDLEITLVNPGTVSSTVTQSGTLIDIDTNGNVTFPGGSPDRFHASLSGSTITLTALGGGQPSDLIIGPADSNGVYSNGNASIQNGMFDPFIQGTGTFTISATGVTSSSIIESVVFSFGTGPDTFVPGVPVTPPSVPEPMSLALLGSGLLAFGAFRWKRS